MVLMHHLDEIWKAPSLLPCAVGALLAGFASVAESAMASKSQGLNRAFFEDFVSVALFVFTRVLCGIVFFLT